MRFGISSIFNKDQSQPTLEEKVSFVEPHLNAEELASLEEEASLQGLPTSSQDVITDQKVVEAERIVRKINNLHDSIDQVARFSSESSTNITAIVKFMESAKGDIKKRVELQAENTDLRSEILKLSSDQRRLQQELETARSEGNTLRRNGAEVQAALKDARESINNMRHSNKKMSEEFRASMVENADLKDHLTEKLEETEQLISKNESLDAQKNNLKVELDSTMKRMVELEAVIAHKDEVIGSQSEKNRTLTGDLGALNRQFSELQDEKIEIESQLEAERESLEQAKRLSEQDQRKHDNEIYALRSELENVASQWRHSKIATKEISAELRGLRERSRSSKMRIQELEQELETAQDLREKHQNEIMEQSSKFRELSLQYETTLIELRQEQLQTSQLSKSVKQLSEETKKTQSLRIRYESAMEQIKELKSLIQDYQLVRQKNMTRDVDLDLELETDYDLHPNADDDLNVVPLMRDVVKK